VPPGGQRGAGTYATGGHEWAYGDDVTPTIGQVVWSFLQRVNQAA
jgi:hypothetical protein